MIRSSMVRTRSLRWVAIACCTILALKALFGKSFNPVLSHFATQIVPGTAWTAINTGEHVQAHGGGVYRHEGKWYWIGEDKLRGNFFNKVKCYVSKDLIEWNLFGSPLRLEYDGDLGPNRIVERPRILWNEPTKQWVMYVHVDDWKYEDRRVGVATSPTICGRYTYHGSFRPMEQESQDIGLFQDSDGKAYLLSEDRKNGLRIHLLSADFRSVESTVYTFPELVSSPALIQRDGLYIMFGSLITGWASHDNVYSTAKSLKGPWSDWKTFAEPGSNTYDSQTNFVLQLPNGNTTIYMGDRWDSDNLLRSSYVWLPLNIDENIVSMGQRRSWMLDSSGDWSESMAGFTYQAETGALFGNAKVVKCEECNSRKAVGNIDGVSSGIAFPSIISNTNMRGTILFHHVNDDSFQKFATLHVNGGQPQQIGFLPSGNETAGTSISSAHVTLNKGRNDIELRGVDKRGPVIDKLEVLYP